MQELKETYRKHLADVAEFAPETVENYMSCLEQYFVFAATQLKIDPRKAGARQLLRWMCYLKEQGLSRSRLIHHKSALTYFFALLVNLIKSIIIRRRLYSPFEKTKVTSINRSAKP